MFFSKFLHFISPSSKFVRKFSGTEDAIEVVDASKREDALQQGVEQSALTPTYFNITTCIRIANKAVFGGVTGLQYRWENPFSEPGFSKYADSGCTFLYRKGLAEYVAKFGVSKESNGITYRLRGRISNKNGIHSNTIVRSGLTYENIERTIVNALFSDNRDTGEVATEPN